MSTVTKILGIIDNPNLPILTNEGLVDQMYGKFVNMLTEQGYTMTAQQSAAVSNFLNSLREMQFLDYIQTIFPFIGSSGNTNGAKVPLIGNKLLDFNSSFNGFEIQDGIIMGLTKTPAVSTLLLSDIQPANDFVGAAYSFTKSNTENVSSILDRLVPFDNTSYQLRIQRGEGIIKLGIYVRTSSGKTTLYANDDIYKEGAGNGYLLGCFQNKKFVRHAMFNDLVDQSTGTLVVAEVDMTAEDMANPLTGQSSYGGIDCLTSLTFFKKMPTLQQANQFMSVLKVFMQALDRESDVL